MHICVLSNTGGFGVGG